MKKKWIKAIWSCNKSWLKRNDGLDTSNLATKSDLASLKAEVDKVDLDTLKNIPADLSNLSNIVDKDVGKNCVWWTGWSQRLMLLKY